MKKTLKILTIISAFILNINLIKAAPYIWPISEKNQEETYIEYGYGPRTYDSTSYDKKNDYAPYELLYKNYENHYGVDIVGIKGNSYDVVAVTDGIVLTTSLDQYNNPGINYIDRNRRGSSFDGGGYGNYIVIQETTTGKCFLYAHLKAGSITLRNGQTVTKGTIIGQMGSSGDSGHQHLHFEVRPNANYVVPNYSMGGRKNLVTTTVYGVQTLNPIDFIGEKPEKQIKQQENEEKQEQPEEEKNEIIETKNINIESIKTNKTKEEINIEIKYDKPITDEYVKLYIKIGEETKNPKYIGKIDEYTQKYVLDLNEYNILTSGSITIQYIEYSSNINVSNINMNLGILNEYTVEKTYENELIHKKGDVNRDGIIDARDASLVSILYAKISTDQVLTKEEQEQMKYADVNNDGKVNSIDSSEILSYYAETSTENKEEKISDLVKCDINNDKRITKEDYNILSQNINKSYNEKYDINNDKKLDEKDKEKFIEILKKNGSR